MRISVIIPTYNEEAHIGHLIRNLLKSGGKAVCEIIVVDGNSTDDTIRISKEEGATTYVSALCRRSAQMNLGAEKSQGDVLYFVHADVVIKHNYALDILEAVQSKQLAGCYRYRFDSPRKVLKVNAFFTRFSPLWCRGGDQTLFVTSELYRELGGFREDFVIMEEYDLIKRLRSSHGFHIIPRDIVVSARKYVHNSYLRVQFANFLVFSLYFWGASQQTLVKVYRKLLKDR